MNDLSQFSIVTSGADPALDLQLNAELIAFNIRETGQDNLREFTVKVNSDNDVLVGGLSGWTWGTSAGIALVWVRDESRGNGIGACLLDEAERIARKRECVQIAVSSYTFQAPQFYERHGYVETARLTGVPTVESADIHLIKQLE